MIHKEPMHIKPMQIQTKHIKPMRLQILKGVLFASIFTALGCDGTAQKTPDALAKNNTKPRTDNDTDTIIKVNKDGNSLTIHSKQGKTQISTVENAKIPTDFPTDVTLPKDIHLQNTMVMPNGAAVNGKVTSTPSALKQVIQKNMLAQGWKEKPPIQQDDILIIIYHKNNRQTTYSINTKIQPTMMSVMVMNTPAPPKTE